MCHYFSLSNDPEMSVSFKTPTKKTEDWGVSTCCFLHWESPAGRYIRPLLLLYLLKEGEIRNVVCKDTPFLLLLKKIQQQRVSLCLKFTENIALTFSRQDSGFVSNLWNICVFFSILEKWRLFLVAFNLFVTLTVGIKSKGEECQASDWNVFLTAVFQSSTY